MTLVKKLEKLILLHSSFLKENDFQIINEMKSGMGCFVDYSNDFLCLRFINDRGICEVLIGQQMNRANLEFYQLDTIRILFVKLKNQPIENHLKKSVLFSWDENHDFLISNYSVLKSIFSMDKILKTKRTLNDIRSARAKIQYGT